MSNNLDLAPRKNHSFARRFGYAWNGLVAAFSYEASFRTQLVATVAVFAFLALTRPAPIWWALIATITSAILSAELFNTALESVIDAVHPDLHPLIGRAKDCAAGAVLILSFAALIVFAALVAHLLGGG